jgi:serine/threonine protein kinase
MDYEDRWHIIDELGEGGQGKVYRVYEASKFTVEHEVFPKIVELILYLSSIQDNKKVELFFKFFREAVVQLIRMEDPMNHGALKVLHKLEDARDADQAEARIKKEIEAMFKVSHANLLKILDYDRDSFKWFVSEYHSKGTLLKNKGRVIGDFIGALRSFRPLVEGASELHKNDIVHRDIKPENVFIDSKDNLVLGDFGLVFFSDEQHTRVSGTFENVGSRDWMPAWAMGMRIEDIKPSFDVFCLGKVLWAMVSNTPILRLWYFDRPQFNLEHMFPNTPSIKFANLIFKKCIVENEEDCLPDAIALLEEIDKVLTIIDRNADLIGEDVKRVCKVCGIGKYQLIVNRDESQLRNFGINAVSGQSFKIFTCNYCGHVQLFSFGDRQTLPAWSG